MPGAEPPDDVAPPQEVAALLAVAPDEFVATRAARARELRAAGHRAEAAALAKVRKPLRLVWVVGELARRHPDMARTAASAAEAVESSMDGGTDTRVLLEQYRELVRRMPALAAELDGTVDPTQVGLALRFVLGDPAARQAWLEGRLLALPAEDGSGKPPADELASRRASRAAAKKAAKARPTAGGAAAPDDNDDNDDDDADDADDADAREAERTAREEAERAARGAAIQRAREATRRLAEEAATARSARDAAAANLSDLEQRLADLKAEVAAAREAVATTDEAATTAQDRLSAAESALADLGEGTDLTDRTIEGNPHHGRH